MNMKYSTDVRERIHTHTQLSWWKTALLCAGVTKHQEHSCLWDTRNAADTEIYCILEWTFSIHLWVPIYSLIRHPLRLTGRVWLELLRRELNPNSKGEQLTCRYEYFSLVIDFHDDKQATFQRRNREDVQTLSQQRNSRTRLLVPSCRITTRLHDLWNAALQLSFGNDFFKMRQKL